VPQGYSLSVAYYSLIDVTHSIYAVIEEQSSPTFKRNSTTTNVEKHKGVFIYLIFNPMFRFICSIVPLILSVLARRIHSFVGVEVHFSLIFKNPNVFSIDDSISEAVLNCLSTICVLACKTENSSGRDATLRTICRAVLPACYFENYIEFASPKLNGDKNSELKAVASNSNVNGEPSQVIAMGYVCPTPVLLSSQLNTTVMLTSKNMQVARLLIVCIQSNGQMLNESWDIVLTTLQHLFWILGMKPTITGGFKSDSSSTGSDSSTALNNSFTSPATTNSSTIVTTALSSELPNLNQMLSKVFEHTSDYTDVSLHHVIAALCKLSSETMVVAQNSPSREPSFFAVAKLLQTALNNLNRIVVFWRPVSAHLLEVSSL
jgi:hypothetical protein